MTSVTNDKKNNTVGDTLVSLKNIAILLRTIIDRLEDNNTSITNIHKFQTKFIDDISNISFELLSVETEIKKYYEMYSKFETTLTTLQNYNTSIDWKCDVISNELKNIRQGLIRLQENVNELTSVQNQMNNYLSKMHAPLNNENNYDDEIRLKLHTHDLIFKHGKVIAGVIVTVIALITALIQTWISYIKP